MRFMASFGLAKSFASALSASSGISLNVAYLPAIVISFSTAFAFRLAAMRTPKLVDLNCARFAVPRPQRHGLDYALPLGQKALSHFAPYFSITKFPPWPIPGLTRCVKRLCSDRTRPSDPLQRMHPVMVPANALAF
jgi:hypothetical protein